VSIIVVAAGVLLAAALLTPTRVPSILRVLAVFLTAKLLGDLMDLIFSGFAEIVFYEDFLRELMAYLGLGLVAWGVIALGLRLTGTEVSPAVPAIGVYILFLFIPPKRRGTRNEPY
jgi:hypothetical protein